jgi:hypothetical protein
MARTSRFVKACLTNAQQIGRMALNHRQFHGALRRGTIRWIGDLQPSPLSDSYTVQIDYRPPARPTVSVLRPKLVSRKPAERIPHTFPDGTICLHLPGEWTSTMPIADTIVPWMSLWLLHYEIWITLGTWMGGGHEPHDHEQ